MRVELLTENDGEKRNVLIVSERVPGTADQRMRLVKIRNATLQILLAALRWRPGRDLSPFDPLISRRMTFLCVLCVYCVHLLVALDPATSAALQQCSSLRLCG
jgi:hypothetical protein